METTRSIHEQFRDELRGFVARHVNNAADVEDVLQQVFLNVHRSLAQGVPPDHLRGWLYRIARNALVDQVRSRRAAEPIGDAAAEITGLAEPPDAVTAALANCIRPMVQQLAPRYRDALLWTELDGLTQADAARRAGVSLSGMKSRVQRGREKLREAMLECCAIELDRSRRPIDAHARPGSAGCSGSACGSKDPA